MGAGNRNPNNPNGQGPQLSQSFLQQNTQAPAAPPLSAPHQAWLAARGQTASSPPPSSPSPSPQPAQQNGKQGQQPQNAQTIGGLQAPPGGGRVENAPPGWGKPGQPMGAQQPSSPHWFQQPGWGGRPGGGGGKGGGGGPLGGLMGGGGLFGGSQGGGKK